MIGVDADGWHVAFTSLASNLDPDHPDTNRALDVFIRHQNWSRPELVSVSTGGTSGNNTFAPRVSDGNGYFIRPVISADGKYVAFVSTASNLVANDTNSKQDVFVRDWRAGTTTAASRSTTGGTSNSDSSSPSIGVDANGVWHVAFVSFANNLVPNDTNGT